MLSLLPARPPDYSTCHMIGVTWRYILWKHSAIVVVNIIIAPLLLPVCVVLMLFFCFCIHGLFCFAPLRDLLVSFWIFSLALARQMSFRLIYSQQLQSESVATTFTTEKRNVLCTFVCTYIFFVNVFTYIHTSAVGGDRSVFAHSTKLTTSLCMPGAFVLRSLTTKCESHPPHATICC